MRKRTDTDTMLADALRACMKDAPIEKVSIKSITDACGLNRQTFYYHFKDIYDLVKWIYLKDVEDAMAASQPCQTWTETIRVFLGALDCDRDFHRAIYDSANYYSSLRQEFLQILGDNLGPALKPRFDELGYDCYYREFLTRLYSLVLYEYVERRARGIAFSDDDESFVRCWVRSLDEQYEGARIIGIGSVTA